MELFVQVVCYFDLFSTMVSGDLFQKPTAEYEALVTGRKNVEQVPR